MNSQDKRQAERLESMNKLFKALRHKKAQLKLIDKAYKCDMERLQNIQKNLIKMNKVL